MQDTTPASAQDPITAEVNRIKSLGRVAIIELANQQLKISRPDLHILPSDYHITVQANAYEVQVNYRSYVQYHPARLQGEELHYDLSVNLVSRKIDPFASIFFRGTFFVATQEDRDNIQFAVGFIPQLPDYVYDIVEHETHFSIRDENLNGYGFFTWERLKSTGERIEKESLSASPAMQPSIAESPDSFYPYRWMPILN